MRTFLGALVLTAAGCRADKVLESAEPSPLTGEGLLSEGCPGEGRAAARTIGVDHTLPGRTAVGTRGDLLLLNDQAAFVITSPSARSTYYHYGGIVADAAPLAGCAVAGDDKLDELGVIVGQLSLTDYPQSTLRAFQGERAEVIADGADGGAAIVRVTGTDAPYWLVEYELVLEAFEDGGKALSSALGTEITIDYILTPDSPVLQVDVRVRNTGASDLSLLTATLMSVGETYDLMGFTSRTIEVGGFGIGYGVPWLVATDGEGALAYGVENGNLGTMHISGMDVLVDVTQALSDPLDMAPGEEESRTFYLSVGATDGPSATAPLSARNPAPLPDETMSLSVIAGVVEGPDGPVEGAAVTLQASSDNADWGDVDRAYTDSTGRFTLYAPVFGDAWSWQLVAAADGRDESEALAVSPGDEGVSVELGARGELAYTLTDSAGQPIPARLNLARDDGQTEDLWLAASGVAALPPGTWTYTVTRGYEYSPVSGTLTVPDGGAATLDVVLDRPVDTSGFLSVDTHVHSSDSTDSDIHPAEQLLHAAAHGLEVVIHTEHENIVDTVTLPAEAGLDAWVTSLIGEEVTATVPEHLTMFPVVPDGSARGGIIEWYGQDLEQVFGAMRERSDGGINLLNHPSYLDYIGWDRVTATPTLDDPTLLGLAPDAALWSWDLDGIEVLNGHRSPFMDGNRRFDNWASMINAGAGLVAVGCSDDHSGWEVGFPRSYVVSSTDDPSELSQDELVDAFRSGALQASAGAFARVLVNETAGLGDLVSDTDGEVSLALSVQAIPEIDVTHAVVFVNCDEVLALAATDPNGVLKLDETVTLPIEGDSWISIAAFGVARLPAGMPQYDSATTPRVLTSPVFIDGDGDGLFTAPGGRECSYVLAAP